MTNEFSIPAHNGVDRAQTRRRRGQLIQEWDDLFFVGNGHVQTGEISIFQEISDFLRLFFKQLIAIISQKSMNLGRVAVSQLSAQKAAFHLYHLRVAS